MTTTRQQVPDLRQVKLNAVCLNEVTGVNLHSNQNVKFKHQISNTQNDT